MTTNTLYTITRYSDVRWPIPGQIVYFSPVKELLSGLHIPTYLSDCVIRDGQVGEVIEQLKNVIRVRFGKDKRSSLVSPMFLIRKDPTKFLKGMVKKSSKVVL